MVEICLFVDFKGPVSELQAVAPMIECLMRIEQGLAIIFFKFSSYCAVTKRPVGDHYGFHVGNATAL